MPRVSVIMPAHNPGPFLKLALKSVVAQKFSDWRCVVVDDGSEEDLGWVVELDPRIEVVRQTNMGAAAARNRGIALADSELIAFLDADDEWLPGKLGAQVETFGAAGLSYTQFERIDGDGVRLGPGYRGVSGYRDL